MSIIKRTVSWILAFSLILSLGLSSGVPIVSAASTDPGSTEETVTMTFEIENAKITDADGTEIPAGNYSAPAGTALSIQVQADTGCELEALKIGSTTIFADPEDTINFTVKEGLVVSLSAKDIAAPVIEAVSRQNDLWVQSAVYTITAADNIAVTECTLTDPEGNSSPLSAGEGGTYTAAISANGIYTVEVKDAIGLTAAYQITEDLIDTTAPQILDLDRVTVGTATSAGYRFAVSDTQSGVDRVTIGTGTQISEITPDNGFYSFTVSSGDTYTVTVTDAAGNTAAQQITDNDIDITAPVISDFVRTETGWQNGSVTYSFTVTDTQSEIGPVSYSIDGSQEQILTSAAGTYQFTVSGNATVTVSAADSLGNRTERTITENQIDVTLPEILNVTRVDTGWVKTATYTFEVSDDLSGIAQVNVAMGTGAPVPLTESNGIYTFTVSDNTGIQIQVTDLAGNTNTASITESLTDNNAPDISSVTRSSQDWQTEAAYQFTAEDGQSGLDTVTVEFNGAETVLTPVAHTYTFAVNENGTYTITAKDTAGNVKTETVTENRIDTTKPEIQGLSRVETGWKTNAHYQFSVREEQSGISSVQVQIGDAQAVALTADAEGNYEFQVLENVPFTVTVTDAVGNVSTASGAESLIDTTAPQITAPIRKNDNWLYSAKYTFQVTDSQAGVRSVTVNPQGGGTVVLTPDGNGKYTYIAEINSTFTVTAVDAVGNTSRAEFTESKVDTKAPTVSNITRDPGHWSISASYCFHAADTQSGIHTVEVYYDDQFHALTQEEPGVYRFTADANGSYQIIVTDLIGNKTTVNVSEALIDQQAPEISQVAPQQTWDPEKNTVQITVTDDHELVSVLITDASGQPWPLTRENDTFSSEITVNGEYTVTATDRAGNSSNVNFTIQHIDTTAPTKPVLSSSANEKWVNVDVSLTANSTDTQSGIAAYWYTNQECPFDKATWKKMDLENGAGSLQLSEEQDLTYYVVAEDAVGRISETAAISVSIDKTAPSDVSLTYSTGEGSGYLRTVNGNFIYNDLVSFTAAAKDAASGVVKYEYRITGEQKDTGWIPLSAGEEGIAPVVADLPDGIYSIYVRVTDQAGNCSGEYTLTSSGTAVKFILENTPATDAARSGAPAVSMVTSEGVYIDAWTAQTVTVNVAGSSAISGIEYYEYCIDYTDPALQDIAWTKVPVSDGKFTFDIDSDTNAVYAFRAVTYAGNQSRQISRVVKVQKTSPNAATMAADLATGTNGWYTKLPGYKIHLPEQGKYFAPVHYIISYDYNGTVQEQITYNGHNAPAVTADGIWNIQITAVDEADNTCTVPQSSLHFEVDTETPARYDVLLNGKSILNAAESANTWDKVNVSNTNKPSDFSIFINENITIEATAQGGDSGLAALYYQNPADHASFDPDKNWSLYEGKVTLKPDSKNNLFFKAVDQAGNVTYFTGASVILDKTAPTGSASEELTLIPRTGNRSKHGFYYGDITIDIGILDPIIGDSKVFSGLHSITYRVYCDGSLTQSGELYPTGGAISLNEGRVQSWTGNMTIDAQKNNSNRISVEVTAIDKAGNTTVTRIPEGVLKIDLDKPVMTSFYNRNDAVTTVNGIDSFTGSRSLTVTVKERNFIPEESLITVVDTDTGKAREYQWLTNEEFHYATIAIEEDGHYQVSASITDAAGNNETYMGFINGTHGAEKFVIDNTVPEITLYYDNNDANQDIYFNAGRIAVIQVDERNFDPDQIKIAFTYEKEDGSYGSVYQSDWTSSENTHTAYVYCNEEGTYRATVSGNDALGNAANIHYQGTATRRFIVDTHIDAPVITGVAADGAYASAIVPKVTVLDKNLDKVSVKLLRTRRGEIEADVTEELISETDAWKSTEGGLEAVFESFAEIPENDGIYTFIVYCEDKAGNKNESSVTFSVNRFGSVYVYDTAVQQIMDDYLQSVTEDLNITEYNPSGLIAGSAQVLITRDGEPILDPVYTVSPVLDGTEKPGESGWYEYHYTISAENFTEDGVYEVVLSTEDAAGNIPENTFEGGAIRFAVDTQAPALTSIVGLEETIYKADSIPVTLTVMDNVEMAQVTVYLNGEILGQWDDLSGYTTEITFQVPSGLYQHIRIVAVDKAGNTIDTDSESFTPGYVFNRDITVSTNAWLRLYANKPLFYGVIAGSAASLAAAAAIVIILLKKKRQAS